MFLWTDLIAQTDHFSSRQLGKVLINIFKKFLNILFRYIFCENLNTFGAGKVLKYLVEVNNRLNAMERKSEDIMELVPDELMQADDDFMQYIGANIEKWGKISKKRELIFLLWTRIYNGNFIVKTTKLALKFELSMKIGLI